MTATKRYLGERELMDDEAEKLAGTLRWVDEQLDQHGYPEPSPIRRRIRAALVEYGIPTLRVEDVNAVRVGRVTW